MSLGAHAEQNQIEAWELAGLQLKRCAQLVLIFCRCLVDTRVLRVDAMHLLHFDRSFRKHRFGSHAKVALGIIRRDVPFIAKKKLDLLPRHFGLQQWIGGQQSVQNLRRRPARECYCESPFSLNGFLRCVQKLQGCRFSDGIRVRQNPDFSIDLHHHVNAPRQSPALPWPEQQSAGRTLSLLRSSATSGRRVPAIRQLLLAPSFPPHNSESFQQEPQTTHPAPAESLSTRLPPCPRAGTTWHRRSCSRTRAARSRCCGRSQNRAHSQTPCSPARAASLAPEPSLRIAAKFLRRVECESPTDSSPNLRSWSCETVRRERAETGWRFPWRAAPSVFPCEGKKERRTSASCRSPALVPQKFPCSKWEKPFARCDTPATAPILPFPRHIVRAPPCSSRLRDSELERRAKSRLAYRAPRRRRKKLAAPSPSAKAVGRGDWEPCRATPRMFHNTRRVAPLPPFRRR